MRFGGGLKLGSHARSQTRISLQISRLLLEIGLASSTTRLYGAPISHQKGAVEGGRLTVENSTPASEFPCLLALSTLSHTGPTQTLLLAAPPKQEPRAQ